MSGFVGSGDGRVKFAVNQPSIIEMVSPGVQNGDAIEYSQLFGGGATGVFLAVTTNTINERTAGSGVTVDGVLLKDGGVSNAAATIFAGFYPKAPQQTISGPGAINVTSWLTNMTTTGADAYTLANGSVIGQKKRINMVVDGGDGTLTPTSLASATTITFNDAGDFVELLWDGTAWNIIQNSGCTVA